LSRYQPNLRLGFEPARVLKVSWAILPEPLAIGAVPKSETVTVPFASLILGVTVKAPVKVPRLTELQRF
jgi:hypothetical protein